jgi:glycine hydroxymethyltransferase
MQLEASRQRTDLTLIASENHVSRSVLDALGSCLTNKYSEGYPGKRYYAGNTHIDAVERLVQSRALSVFGVDARGEWGVNVQSLSGSEANFAVYTALMKPQDRLLGLALTHGGHLTHGHKVSASALYFQAAAYHVDATTGRIDYDELDRVADEFRPAVIVAGTSAYSREIDYARIRRACDRVGARMLADMAHIAGLVAARLVASPFDFADVVTTTTHKTLRGPRGALIFARTPLMPAIDRAVFPTLQGGPHNNNIAAIGACLHEAAQPSFVEYQRRVRDNVRALAQHLVDAGYTLVTGGTDVHLLLVDVKRSRGVDGERAAAVCEWASIITNANTVPSDKTARRPSGVRLGTPALTTRGARTEHMAAVALLFDRAVRLAADAATTAESDGCAPVAARSARVSRRHLNRPAA